MSAPANERWISLGSSLPSIPERLLLAHSRGQVLFITGAGSSQSAGLPDFRSLVLGAYATLDSVLHAELVSFPAKRRTLPKASLARLSSKQSAEARRFIDGDYDVVLGMLERRMDVPGASTNNVRATLLALLRSVPNASGAPVKPIPSKLHKALIRLANRGAASTIVTTNFDLLLEQAAPRGRGKSRTLSLGAIPRPGHGPDFAGVLHIHGALNRDPAEPTEFIVTDQDFGEFYLRRRVVSDFIYDAARLYHLVLVGYSLSDAPMRYLLNAVAADVSRFTDLKERFAFVGMQGAPSQIELEDWRGRGITPIPYNTANSHKALSEAMQRWSELSAINGQPRKIDALVKKLVTIPRKGSTDADRDLFDHLIRRSSNAERFRLAALASRMKAELGWLDAMRAVVMESSPGGRRAP